MGKPERDGQMGVAWRWASQHIGRQDARLLLEHAGGVTYGELIAYPERELSASQYDRFATLVSRRASGEPLAYLLGSTYFCGLEFFVSPAVLIPRPETEILVNRAVEYVQRQQQAPTQTRAQTCGTFRIVDLGTGSGIVAIMLARLCPSAELTAVDISAAAIEVARVNAQRHGVPIRLLEGDWYAPLGDERFDLIVSNPPYIAAGDRHLQDDGLPFEPFGALSDGIAGGDGMECIRTLVEGATEHLLPGGWLLMEHGYDQAVQVRELLRRAGLHAVTTWLDSAAIERVSGGSYLPD